ncbi:Uncharacterised protein [uncultured Blautia sp.]|nr:Uncharacterised protein [uncultured Blautia sp.]
MEVAVSDLNMADFRAQRNHFPRSLMTQQRRKGFHALMGRKGSPNDLKISAIAEAAGMYPHKRLIGSRLGNGDIVHDLYVFRAEDRSRLHKAAHKSFSIQQKNFSGNWSVFIIHEGLFCLAHGVCLIDQLISDLQLILPKEMGDQRPFTAGIWSRIGHP